MFYVFSYTPTIDDTEAAPHVLELQLTAGVIHQVDIVFQNGCEHEEFVQVLDDSHQLWPSNTAEKIRGNATVISFREFYEMKRGNNRLKAKFWTTLTTDFKEIIIQIGILPKSILQPLSFEELLKAASGVE